MTTLNTIDETRSHLHAIRKLGQAIVFVPTMGALHEGHAALVRAASKTGGYVVVSIFVNPTQFGPNEDFHRYPRTLEADQTLCAAAGASLIFHPSPAEMYPGEAHAYVDVLGLGDHLCGPSRPGHFRGVCTVVLKLFNIVQPDIAIFGAKDGQQARILRKMTLDLNVPTTIQIEPTVREADGLAMSSRNRYLSAEERAVAPRIYEALQSLQTEARGGQRDVVVLEANLRAKLQAIPAAKLDYATIVDDVTIAPITRLDRPAFCAVAVFLGRTRLIDNVTLG
ncbi:MAG: pantoate--beta-alanine ligase [Fimbriiglobus sp.]